MTSDKEEDEQAVAFKAAHVFDVSQTDGSELPHPVKVEGVPSFYLERLRAFVQSLSIKLEYADLNFVEGFAEAGRTCEHVIKGNGAIDLLAERPGERTAVEVETGKSDVKANLTKIQQANFDRVVLVATSPSAVTVCKRAVDDTRRGKRPRVELLTWLDVS